MKYVDCKFSLAFDYITFNVIGFLKYYVCLCCASGIRTEDRDFVPYSFPTFLLDRFIFNWDFT